jgi:hypothetical protein
MTGFWCDFSKNLTHLTFRPGQIAPLTWNKGQCAVDYVSSVTVLRVTDGSLAFVGSEDIPGSHPWVMPNLTPGEYQVEFAGYTYLKGECYAHSRVFRVIDGK